MFTADGKGGLILIQCNDVESVEGLLNYENRREAGFTSD